MSAHATLHLRPARLGSLIAGLAMIVIGCGTPTEPGPEASDSRGLSTHRARDGIAGSLAPGATPRDRAAAAGLFVLHADEHGVPLLLLATAPQPAFAGATPEGAARFHVERHAAGLGLGPAAVASARVAAAWRLRSGGAIARMKQVLGGVEVHGAALTVRMSDDLALLAIAGRLEPIDALAAPPRGAFGATAADALAVALQDLAGVALPPRAFVETLDESGDVRLRLAQDGAIAMPEPARARPVYFVDGDRLVAAWSVELYAGPSESSDSAAWRYVVAALDGRVLERRSLTAFDAFDYRVFATPTGDKRPLDGPLADFTPHPTGKPDGTYPALIAPSLIRMEAFNHNPMGQADPWLAANANATSGNNVDAYTDRRAPDGFSQGDLRATLTGDHAFDRTYDFLKEPTDSDGQAMAGVTNLFYVTNWLHDYFYDVGFHEAAGNAQLDNFGRGGKGGDSMRAEAQDNVLMGTRNNSNMSTPSDGMRPRMQVYVWSSAATVKLTLNPGGTPSTLPASFGPGTFDVTGAVVLANDGAGTVTDACEAIVNNVAGKIVLADRGNCTFKKKVANAQAAGAIGVIIADSQNGNSPPMLGDDPQLMTKVTIPAMSVTLAAGNALKASLMNGAVNATLFSKRDPERDGTLDNAVLAHEWGHYLHHRLSDCGSQQCGAISEGWGDFVALHMISREGDNLDGTYGFAMYAAKQAQDPGYYGLRRQPYSVDTGKDGLTFKHISDGEVLPNTPRVPSNPKNSEVHNAGEVWATMMWEAYVALQKAGRARMPALAFEEVRRRLAQYVVEGIQLVPRDATFTETRDGVLAAALAHDAADAQVIAEAFARRGAGTCAVSPPRGSTDLKGVVEARDVAPRFALGAITLDDGLKSCDGDGVLDAGERGRLVIEVVNGGASPLANTTVDVSTSTPGIAFPGGTHAELAEVKPFATGKVELEVTLDRSVRKAGILQLTARADNATACEKTQMRDVSWRIHVDERTAVSATDDVEAPHSAWTVDGTDAKVAAQVWSRTQTAPDATAWRGLDWGTISDTWLASPDLHVLPNASFVMSFDHRFLFEAATEMGNRVYYDGGVIELSDDGGTTWDDVSMWVMPGYVNTLTDVADNPLSDRKTYTDQSAKWPDREKVTLDFGQVFAGKTVRVRFRIGSDQASSQFGWEIDNIGFAGIDGTPFGALVDDAGRCTMEPGVDAGAADLAMPAASADLASAAGDMAMPQLSNGCECGVGRRSSSSPPGLQGPLAMLLGLAMLTLRRRRR